MPTIRKETAALAPAATLNTPDRKSWGGITGSLARRSTPTRMQPSAMVASPSKTITGETHEYSIPPHVRTRINDGAAAVRRAIPA